MTLLSGANRRKPERINTIRERCLACGGPVFGVRDGGLDFLVCAAPSCGWCVPESVAGELVGKIITNTGFACKKGHRGALFVAGEADNGAGIEMGCAQTEIALAPALAGGSSPDFVVGSGNACDCWAVWPLAYLETLKPSQKRAILAAAGIEDKIASKKPATTKAP